MSDIEKIIEKHSDALSDIFHNGGSNFDGQLMCGVLEEAVREAVEAERGRHPRRWKRDELAQAPDGFYADGALVYPRSYCQEAYGDILFFGPIPCDGDRITPTGDDDE